MQAETSLAVTSKGLIRKGVTNDFQLNVGVFTQFLRVLWEWLRRLVKVPGLEPPYLYKGSVCMDRQGRGYVSTPRVEQSLLSA